MTNQYEINCFVDYCYQGNVEKVLDYLDNGMYPGVISSNGLTPLKAAINGDNLEVVECLITWRVDVNQEDWTALHELIDSAIDNMIQNDENDVKPITLEILKELIGNGADLNKKTRKGEKPLDLLRVYASNKEKFEQLKDCFRSVIHDIDERTNN